MKTPFPLIPWTAVPPEIRCRTCRRLFCCAEHRISHELRSHVQSAHQHPVTGRGRALVPPTPARDPGQPGDLLRGSDDLAGATAISDIGRKRKRESLDYRRDEKSLTLAASPRGGAIADSDVLDDVTPSRADTLRVRASTRESYPCLSPREKNITSEDPGEVEISNLSGSVEDENVTPRSRMAVEEEGEGGVVAGILSWRRLPPPLRRRSPRTALQYTFRRRRLLTPLEEEEGAEEHLPAPAEGPGR